MIICGGGVYFGNCGSSHGSGSLLANPSSSSVMKRGERGRTIEVQERQHLGSNENTTTGYRYSYIDSFEKKRSSGVTITRNVGNWREGMQRARGVFNELEDTGKGWKLA